MAHFQRERPRVRGTLTMRIYSAELRCQRRSANAIRSERPRARDRPDRPSLINHSHAFLGAGTAEPEEEARDR